MDEASRILLAVGVAIAAAVLAAVLLVLPWQAYGRGHGALSWFVLQVVAINPVYPLILLATLPNRARARLREEFARELDAKLPRADAPAAAPAEAAADRSIGDLPTAAPGGGSVGDDVTRA